MSVHNSLKIIQSLIWSPPILVLLGLASIYLTFALKGIQFRYLGLALRLSFSRSGQDKKSAGELTHFQALMTSLAGAIGTGNIAGVATALTAGGMGALFWMWLIAISGMAVKYCESFLAVRYRETNSNGEMSGGPMYFLAKGARLKKAGVLYAFLGSFAAIGTGNMVQVNSVADAVSNLAPVPCWMTGCTLALLTALVLLRGVRSIGLVAAYFVPVMAGLYVAGACIILALNYDKIPAVLLHILRCAFEGQAAYGGFLGATVTAAIQSGIARGIFSHEGGLGTSSIASAAARTSEPGTQAMVSMTGAFLSTIIVCTMTGLVIGVSDMLGQISPLTGRLLNGAPLAMRAFGSQLPGGEFIVSFGLIFFAWSTILAWAYYGEKCLEFLAGTRRVAYYRLLYIACMIPAAVLELESVWTLADIMNGLMMIPNMIGILYLRKVLISGTREYLLKKR